MFRLEGNIYQCLIDKELEDELHEMLNIVYLTVLKHLHEDAWTILYDQRSIDLIQLLDELKHLLGLNSLEKLSRSTQINEGCYCMLVAWGTHVLLLLDIGEQMLRNLGGINIFMILLIVDYVCQAL